MVGGYRDPVQHIFVYLLLESPSRDRFVQYSSLEGLVDQSN